MAPSSLGSTGSLTDKRRGRNGKRQMASRRSAFAVFAVINLTIVSENRREHTTVNLSFFIFISTAFLLVYLKRALATIKNAMKKQ